MLPKISRQGKSIFRLANPGIFEIGCQMAEVNTPSNLAI